MKVTAREENPTNVFKLSPIAPPEAYESEEKSTKKDKVEDKPIDTSLVHLPIHQPVVHLYKDLSRISDDQGDATTEINNEETPVNKVVSPLKVPTNVFKLSPIAPPEEYSKKDDQEGVPSSILVREIVQDDKKTDLTELNDDVST